MQMGKSKDTLMNAFEALRGSLKDASIDAIRQDRFGESRELTEIMEQLASLESRANSAIGGQVPAASGEEKSQAPRKDHYPRFYRSGNTLYKEGLKQNGKSVYTQKVDRVAFDTIISAIAAHGKRKFKPASLLEKINVPSYQFYIVLNVLQEPDLVRNPERGVYQLQVSGKSLDPSEVWTSIESEATD
jgi:hypothetical protein